MKKLVALVMFLLVMSGVAGVALFNSSKAQMCMARHADNFLGCLLAGPMALTVHVTATVDEVSFYSTDDTVHPMATIVTNGKDVTQTVSLPTSSQYYFEVKQGSQVYRGRTVGFSTNQARAVLSIRALDHYEGW